MTERPYRITVRFSNDEQKELREQADVAVLSVSEYVRRRILGKHVVSKTDLKLLAELRRIGGLLKHIHLETRGAYSELTAEALSEVIRFVRNFDKTSLRGEQLP